MQKTSMTAKITPYLAKKLFKVDEEYNTVHCFRRTSSPLIIGCDYDYSRLAEDLQRARDIRIAGENAMKSGHGIAVLLSDEADWVFFEHKEEEMNRYLELLEEAEPKEKEKTKEVESYDNNSSY